VNNHEGNTMTTSVSQPRGGSNSNATHRGSGNGLKLEEISATVEYILSAIEQRGENGLSHHGGPLTNTEIVKLSMLCTQQTEWSNKGKNRDMNKNNGSSILSEDIGFADVDADMMAQLVEHLEKHVALASQIDLVQSSYNTIQKLKKDNGHMLVGCKNIDEVSEVTRWETLGYKRPRSSTANALYTLNVFMFHVRPMAMQFMNFISGYVRDKDLN